jgi:hypothetical protein
LREIVLSLPFVRWPPPHCLCRVLDRVDDVLIAGTAAEISVKSVADFILGGLRVPHQQLVCGKNHSRSAETALQPVTFPKGLLNRMEFLPLRQTFDGQHIGAISLDRKDRAGLDGGVVEHHRARPADAGLAAYVGARQPDHIPKKMNQEQPRLHFLDMIDAVDPDRNFFLPRPVHLLRPYLNGLSTIKFFLACHGHITTHPCLN